MNDYKEMVKAHILDEERFVRAVFHGQRRGYKVPWHQVIVRPVLIKGRRHLQFSYHDATRDITKNYI